jgi:hypothetical protein
MSDQIEKNIEDFNKNGYCVVRDVFDSFYVSFISQYALFDEMQNFSLESQRSVVPGSNTHSKYVDPAMETVLLLLQEVVEQNTGTNLFPTYSYYRVYRNNDELLKHRDRESCEIAVTVAFDNSYKEYDSNFSWPIFIEDNEINLNPGDILIYKGFEKEHSRNKLIFPQECWQVQAFLFYVQSEGKYKEWKWDKRESIGSWPHEICRHEHQKLRPSET